MGFLPFRVGFSALALGNLMREQAGNISFTGSSYANFGDECRNESI